jgi:hypothetical protein
MRREMRAIVKLLFFDNERMPITMRIADATGIAGN